MMHGPIRIRFKFYIACVLEGDGDSEPEDTRPAPFRKAGSESSAIESKIIKVSSSLFVYGVCVIRGQYSDCIVLM